MSQKIAAFVTIAIAENIYISLLLGIIYLSITVFYQQKHTIQAIQHYFLTTPIFVKFTLTNRFYFYVSTGTKVPDFHVFGPNFFP